MNKRGQISSQVFLYAFGVIVVALIVFAGYKGMTSFAKSSQDASLRVFESEFSNEMEVLAVKRGSAGEFTYQVPVKYDRFCVFDNAQSDVLGLRIVKDYPLMLDSLKDGTENIFLFSKDDFYALKIDFVKFKLFPYYFCQDLRNGLVRFNARGDVVQGKASAVIQIQDIAEKKIFSNHSEIQILRSTDERVIIEIPKYTQLNQNEPVLSIKVLSSGDLSETYSFKPDDLMFVNNDAIFYIKIKSCAGYESAKWEIGYDEFNPESCEDSYIRYHVNRIN